MPRFTVSSSISLVATLLLTACAGDARSTNPLSPTVLQAPPSLTAPLMVEVDAVCAGRETDIQVFVDATLIGITNPGDTGVSRMVTVGDHRLSAVSRQGTQWGPFPTTVEPGGRVERLGCMPADAL